MTKFHRYLKTGSIHKVKAEKSEQTFAEECKSIMQATTKITEKYYADVYNVNHGVKLDKGRGCLTSNLLVAISKIKHGQKFWDENFCLEVQAAVGRGV